MIAENIISQPKYSDKLKNLVLICEAMDEFAEALTKEKDTKIYLLKADLAEVKNILRRQQVSIAEDSQIYNEEINRLKQENNEIKNLFK